MKTIRLRSPADLPKALHALGKEADAAMLRSMRNAARYGAAQVLATSAKTKPRPRATGTYERSWLVTKLPDGAALSNTAGHAQFVEVGRRRGKRPPIIAILAWMSAKRLATNGASRRSVAYLIARKIGKFGIKGRFVLERTMPLIAKRVLVEVELELKRAISRHRG